MASIQPRTGLVKFARSPSTVRQVDVLSSSFTKAFTCVLKGPQFPKCWFSRARDDVYVVSVRQCGAVHVHTKREVHERSRDALGNEKTKDAPFGASGAANDTGTSPCYSTLLL